MNKIILLTFTFIFNLYSAESLKSANSFSSDVENISGTEAKQMSAKVIKRMIDAVNENCEIPIKNLKIFNEIHKLNIEIDKVNLYDSIICEISYLANKLEIFFINLDGEIALDGIEEYEKFSWRRVESPKKRAICQRLWNTNSIKKCQAGIKAKIDEKFHQLIDQIILEAENLQAFQDQIKFLLTLIKKIDEKLFSKYCQMYN